MNPTHVIYYEPIQIDEDLSYKEKLISVLAREMKALCTRDNSFVKVLW